jgi:hypothetical protein
VSGVLRFMLDWRGAVLNMHVLNITQVQVRVDQAAALAPCLLLPHMLPPTRSRHPAGIYNRLIQFLPMSRPSTVTRPLVGR